MPARCPARKRRHTIFAPSGTLALAKIVWLCALAGPRPSAGPDGLVTAAPTHRTTRTPDAAPPQAHWRHRMLFNLTIEGNLAAKPELRYTPDGTAVARMRVLRTA